MLGIEAALVRARLESLSISGESGKTVAFYDGIATCLEIRRRKYSHTVDPSIFLVCLSVFLNLKFLRLRMLYDSHI